MTNDSRAAEDILAAFAVEPNHDKTTLDWYLKAYPDLTSELLELALELEFDDVDDAPLDLDSPLVVASWRRYSQVTPMPLTAASFTRDVAWERASRS
jgi:hypothetical protein